MGRGRGGRPDRGRLPGPGRGRLVRLGHQRAPLPFPLRGDGADLPVLDVTTPRDQKGLDDARKAFVEGCRERGQREERRLAYVAVTRARHLLLCSGYWWGTAVRPRGPSMFLAEISRVRLVQVDEWAPVPPDGAANPMPPPAAVPWPADPLGARRPLVEQGATLVRAAAGDLDEAPEDGTLFAEEDLLALGWAREAELLLAERARAGAGEDAVAVPLPGHLSVSDLVALARDPAGLARRLRRPLPAGRRRRPAAAPPSTPGWRSGSAPSGCSTSTSCPARPTRARRRTPTWRCCRSASWPASGPTGRRPRWRCPSRPPSAGW